MEARIENLEILSMEQENTIETLNREIQRQQLQIKILEEQIQLLNHKLESINKEELIKPEEEEAPPPHY